MATDRYTKADNGWFAHARATGRLGQRGVQNESRILQHQVGHLLVGLPQFFAQTAGYLEDVSRRMNRQRLLAFRHVKLVLPFAVSSRPNRSCPMESPSTWKM